MIIFEQHLVGGDRNFGYLLGDKKSQTCALIDPSYSPNLLVNRAHSQNLEVKWILNTHLHHDHINGNGEVKALCPEAILAAFDDAELLLKDGDEIFIGSLPLRILHVPGHSPDHLVFYQPTFGIALTGDHLFVGKIGGTWSEEAARQQFFSLQKLFKELPLETTIWPGHNVGARPSSTLALEKDSNPFLQPLDVASFIAFKENWSEFKAKNGLI